ncbi:MAG: cardiolipin synthase, partial [Myxococcota bacterium]
LADTVFPATDDNEVVAIDSHDAFDIMERDILAAEDHIHALFYIWRDDQTGRRFRDVLIESARRGVRVRVLSDAFGSPAFSTRFVRPLKRAGVAVERFLPPRIFSPSPRINFRNHRKILVIDGHIGFIGGFNVGDEYRTQWRDLGVRMRGPAVDQLQEIFAEDWYYASDENLADKRYFGCWTRADDHANAHRVASIASGPDAESAPIEDALFAAINMARQRIRLVTPYFVPTRSLLTALRSARYRGVTVEVMVPSKSDVRIVRYASRSYYPELLESGVRIYEYQPSMLHAKFATFDDELVLVGSANIDNRSFRLNFEASCVVAGPELNQTLNHVFDEDKLECKRIEPADLARLGPVQQLVDATANLLSPLL